MEQEHQKLEVIRYPGKLWAGRGIIEAIQELEVIFVPQVIYSGNSILKAGNGGVPSIWQQNSEVCLEVLNFVGFSNKK